MKTRFPPQIHHVHGTSRSHALGHLHGDCSGLSLTTRLSLCSMLSLRFTGAQGSLCAVQTPSTSPSMTSCAPITDNHMPGARLLTKNKEQTLPTEIQCMKQDSHKPKTSRIAAAILLITEHPKTAFLAFLIAASHG